MITMFTEVKQSNILEDETREMSYYSAEEQITFRLAFNYKHKVQTINHRLFTFLT